MAEDTSSTASNTIPFPTLTILYLPAEADNIIEEVSQKYCNITVEYCNGFFHGGIKRQYKKITIWSQGIDSLWLMQSSLELRNWPAWNLFRLYPAE